MNVWAYKLEDLLCGNQERVEGVEALAHARIEGQHATRGSYSSLYIEKEILPISEPAEQEYTHEPLSWNERFFFLPDIRSNVYSPSKSPTRERRRDPLSR